jgi:hypothetical protein
MSIVLPDSPEIVKTKQPLRGFPEALLPREFACGVAAPFRCEDISIVATVLNVSSEL